MGSEMCIRDRTDTEQNVGENDFQLTLATPFGFINSDHTVSRSSSFNDQTTLLTANFKSQHRTREISINANVGFDIFHHSKFSLVPSFGLAYNRILNLDHSLISRETNHDAFDFKTSSIESNETGLNKSYLSLLGGLELNYQLGRGYSLGLSFVHREGVTPIYLESDFSSFEQAREFNFLLSYDF